VGDRPACGLGWRGGRVGGVRIADCHFLASIRLAEVAIVATSASGRWARRAAAQNFLLNSVLDNQLAVGGTQMLTAAG
jgi:hypothetical protein